MERHLPKRSRVFRWAIGGLFLMLGNLPWMASVHAAGQVGTGTPASCTQTALTTALTGGGTVTFNCGGAATTITVTTPLTITQDTNIEGGNLITLTGGLTTRLFDVTGSLTSLTLNDIILDKANSGNDGGAIKSVGTLVLNNVTIQFSQTTGCGGAIWSSGTMIISNSTFDNNTGVAGGGAICTGQLGTTRLQVTDSSFSSNKATSITTGYGGAILVTGPVAEVTIVDSGFFSNSALLGGGLAVWTGGVATLLTQNAASPLFFLGNSATENGGAIYNLGELSISKAELNLNTVPQNTGLIGYGGAIANFGSLTLYDSLLTVNQARYGGGLFVGNNPNAQADIRRTVFSQNTAVIFGGGMYVTDAIKVEVSDSVFRKNTANLGGGIARFNGLLEISNSSLTENQASAAGGGLYMTHGSVTDTALVRATNVTFGGNTAFLNQGGGIYSNGGSSVLKNLTLKDNTNGLFNFGTFTTHLGNSVLDNPGTLNCDGNGLPLSLDGGNLSTDNSCAVEQNGVLDAQLGPQATNTNGINQTRYYPPLAGSPLINGAGNCPTLDQRGASRPDACDIGAVEYGGLAWFTYLPLIKK